MPIPVASSEGFRGRHDVDGTELAIPILPARRITGDHLRAERRRVDHMRCPSVLREGSPLLGCGRR